MSFVLCGSANQAEFSTEMMIHFTDIKHLHSPDPRGVHSFRSAPCSPGRRNFTHA